MWVTDVYASQGYLKFNLYLFQTKIPKTFPLISDSKYPLQEEARILGTVWLPEEFHNYTNVSPKRQYIPWEFHFQLQSILVKGFWCYREQISSSVEKNVSLVPDPLTYCMYLHRHMTTPTTLAKLTSKKCWETKRCFEFNNNIGEDWKCCAIIIK